MELLENMLKRRSCRIFNDQPVSENDLNMILKAALSSPSGHGWYPVKMIVVNDKEVLKKLEGMREGGGKVIAGSNVSIFVIADSVLSDTWIEDCSIYLSNMHLMADSLGLGSCWIQARNRVSAEGGDVSEFVKSILNYPENYTLLGALAVGHIDSHPEPHDEAFFEKMAAKISYNSYKE